MRIFSPFEPTRTFQTRTNSSGHTALTMLLRLGLMLFSATSCSPNPTGGRLPPWKRPILSARVSSTRCGRAATPRVLTFAGLSQIGPGVSAPQFLYFWNAYQIYDDAFVTKGAHSLKFGGTFENDQMNATTRTADFVGTYSFKSISDFLTNQPSRVRGALPSVLTPRYMRTSIFGAYLQDDWRVRPNLTLNLGVRYEMSTGITEAKGK